MHTPGAAPSGVAPFQRKGGVMNARRTVFPLLLVLAVCLPVLVHAQAIVPNVLGMAQVDAETAITAAGFNVSARAVYDSSPAGTVFFQSPSGGIAASPGSTVTISVSMGSLSPEAYNYQGLIYSFLGIVGGLSFVIGIKCGMAG